MPGRVPGGERSDRDNLVDGRGRLTGVLEHLRSWTPPAVDALAALESRVVRADGGRLKLEWGTLRARSGEVVRDLLWWEGDRLLGFLGIYSFGSTPELAGMVDPAARRRGIGTTLLEAALALLRPAGTESTLLVTPRQSPGGREFALRYGGTLDRSEHALVLDQALAEGSSDPRITLRRATPDDAAEIGRLLGAAFGWAPGNLPEVLAAGDEPMTLVAFDGVAVGSLRTTRDGAVGGVYGFAVDPQWQGRGIGRDVLRRVCRQLLAEGADRVALEVAVDNEHALGLYTSLGFVPVATEDYYCIRLAGSQPARVGWSGVPRDASTRR
ncbi:MAG: GNAT family N-acetyltransferase [Actinomycetota bacterium]|nr:GNAT family N-acetyltransferase [Actinomycetota bacterium]